MTSQDRFEAAIPNPCKLIHSFTLPRPPSVNALYDSRKSGRRVKSDAYRKWVQFAKPDLVEQMIKKGIYNQRVIDCPISVILTIEPKTNHKQDATNYEKAASDLMVHCGVISDDSLIQTNIQRIDWDKLGGDVIHYDIYGV